MILALILLVANATCPKGMEATGTHIPEDCVWPTSDQSCGIDAHRHSMDLDERGHYVVNREKHEPDIVFDGLCHDNNDEHVIDPPERKKLPVPKPYNSEDL